jgi:hypothetical protein
MFRLALDPGSGVHTLVRIANGVETVLTTGVLALNYNTWYSVSVTTVVNNYRFQVFVDGAFLLEVTDWSWNSLGGAVGFYAASRAQFDNAGFSTDCTAAGSCSGATDGGTCTFTCPLGMIASGAATRTCASATGLFSLAPLTCSLPAPVFPAAAVSVAENAQKFDVIGAPLQASVAAALPVSFRRPLGPRGGARRAPRSRTRSQPRAL